MASPVFADLQKMQGSADPLGRVPFLLLKHSVCCGRRDICPEGVSRVPGESRSIPANAFRELHKSPPPGTVICRALGEPEEL